MNYQSIYDNLVAKRKAKPATGYTERHHILPKSLGGTDDPANLVVLTGREHWVAHLLLWKITKLPCMAFACHRMTSRCNDRGISLVKNSRMYQSIREANSITIGKQNAILNKGENNPMFGTSWYSNNELKISKRILSSEPIPEGWVKGRNVWLKKPKPQYSKEDIKARQSARGKKLAAFNKSNRKIKEKPVRIKPVKDFIFLKKHIVVYNCFVNSSLSLEDYRIQKSYPFTRQNLWYIISTTRKLLSRVPRPADCKSAPYPKAGC